MQCSCGGEAVKAIHTKQVHGVVVATLEYHKCTSCGRQGPQSIYEIDTKGEKKRVA